MKLFMHHLVTLYVKGPVAVCWNLLKGLVCLNCHDPSARQLGQVPFCLHNPDLLRAYCPDHAFRIIITFPNGNKYVGEWKDDEQNGQGTLTYTNGDKYVGEFKDNKYDGQGIIYSANGNVKESGNYLIFL